MVGSEACIAILKLAQEVVAANKYYSLGTLKGESHETAFLKEFHPSHY